MRGVLGRGGSLETARERLASAGRGGGRSSTGHPPTPPPPKPTRGADPGRGRRPPPGRARAAPYPHPAGGKRGIRGGEGTVGLSPPPRFPPPPPGECKRLGLSPPPLPPPRAPTATRGCMQPPPPRPPYPGDKGPVWGMGGRGCPFLAPRRAAAARLKPGYKHAIYHPPPEFRSPSWGSGRSGYRGRAAALAAPPSPGDGR